MPKRSPLNNFLIYKITNLINKKIYIGRTIQLLKDRWSKHVSDSKNKNAKMAISHAIAKYGAQNFSIELIEKCASLDEMKRRESFYISSLNSMDRNVGYNLILHDIIKNKATYTPEGSLKLSSAIHRKHVANQFELFGVFSYKTKTSIRWKARINLKNIVYEKVFNIKDDAIFWRDKMAVALYKEKANLNNSSMIGYFLKADLENFLLHEQSEKTRKKNKIKGVKIRNGLYFSYCKGLYIGVSKTEIEAAKLYDIFSWNIFANKSKLNFPQDIVYYSSSANQKLVTDFLEKQKSLNPSSNWRGVHFDKTDNLWTSFFRFKGSIFKRKFKLEADAAEFRDKVCYYFTQQVDKLNFPEKIESYKADMSNLENFINKKPQ